MTEKKFLTFRELHQATKISQRDLRRFIHDGLPIVARGQSRRFDLGAVEAWLVEHGHQEPGERIARTYQALADALGMGGKNPTRILSRWAAVPGFPGTPGAPGKQIAHFPVEKIREWITLRNGGSGVGGGDGNQSELVELRIERERLKLEREIREEMLAAERLADVDEVARHNARCVANAKAVLEPMADAVVGILPTKAPAAKQWQRVLRSVHSAVQQLLDDAYTEIEGLIQGDTDEVSDDD